MYLPFFLKVSLTALALALISFFLIPGADLILLVKLIALSIGVSILISLFYPSVRGIQKGDKVLVSKTNLPSFLGVGRMGTAIEEGRVNKEIKIRFADGREAVGIVENYGSALNMPKVRLLYEETIAE